MVVAVRGFLIITLIVLALVIVASKEMRPLADPFKNPVYRICTPDEKSCTGSSE